MHLHSFLQFPTASSNKKKQQDKTKKRKEKQTNRQPSYKTHRSRFLAQKKAPLLRQDCPNFRATEQLFRNSPLAHHFPISRENTLDFQHFSLPHSIIT